MVIDRTEFKKILSMNVEELKEYCHSVLEKNRYTEIEVVGNEVYDDPGYLFAKGEIPVLLVAHLDRQSQLEGSDAYNEYGEKIYKINSDIIEESDNGNKWAHPYQICGDDRCGVYLILELIKKYKVSVIFTDKEECAPYGREKFKDSTYLNFVKNEIKYLCQIDREGNSDLVYYDNKKLKVEKKEFKDYIGRLTGYKEVIGSKTDIVDLTNWTGVSSFNISCGYYKQHYTNEYIVLSDMEKTYSALERLLDDISNAEFFKN